MAWIEANLALAVAGAAIALVLLGWLLLARRRTRVRLSRGDDDTPARRNQALIDTPPVVQAAPAPIAASNDLSRIKGLGPKLATQLEALGITSIAQIAQWDDAAIDRIDAQLGRFAGRIRQDDWVAQARLLESGDVAGYEARFGRR